ncbi:MAG: hypothetical protein HC919_08915 [Oscillatoriales cyanobacterium SM2_2_1]|nr:hypothetical protein [Oscillatoriales cyanobacterium SM2_2_1]
MNSLSNLQQSSDKQIWQRLRQAIAASSGFKRWQRLQGDQAPDAKGDIDTQVCAYLRETLDTLAY